MEFQRRTWLKRSAAFLAAGAAFPMFARAQKFPDRPITLVVPVAPGGTNDAVSRALAAGMAKHLGIPVVVENRVGAAGVVGLQSVLRSPADGYTLLMAGGNVLTVLPVLDRKLPYKLEDIQPISLVSEHPFFLYASNDSGITSIQKLVEMDRQKPGSISYASHGQGATNHLCAELLSMVTGVKMIHVPYKGGNQAMPDIISGRVQVMFDTEVAMPLAQSGKFRAIAVSHEARIPAYANIPTFKESGFPDFNWKLWFALVGPKGMPQAAVDAINDAIRKTVAEPGFLESNAARGLFFVPKSDQQLTQFLADQTRVVQKLATTRGISLST